MFFISSLFYSKGCGYFRDFKLLEKFISRQTKKFHELNVESFAGIFVKLKNIRPKGKLLGVHL